MADRDLVFTVLGIDKASRTFDNVGRSMDRMSSRATKALGGITGAAGAASAAVAGSVGAASAAFIGLGAVALRENAEVKESFRDLSDTVNEGLAQDAAPLKDAFTGAADDIASAYQRLRPEMRQAFEASAPHVATLTSGVTGFAEHAMPGMIDAVESADPVMQGFRRLMIDTGQGTRAFFEIVSESSDEAGQGIEHFGQLARDSLPEIGGILTNLTGLWAEHGDEVVDVVTRMLGVVNDLTSSMPMMSASIGTALDVLQGILGVVDPLSDQIGTLIGLWLSLGAAMKGIRAVQGIVASVAGSVTNFADASRRAAGARGVGGLRGAAIGLTGVLGGPWGIAVAAATTTLAVFGEESQQAERDQRSLATALQESGGAFDATAREAIVSSDQYQEVADAADTLGISQKRLVDSLINGGEQLQSLKDELGGTKQGLIDTAREALTFGQATDAQEEASARLLVRLDGLREMITGAEDDQRQLNQSAETAGEKLAGAVPGASALTEAIKTLKEDTSSTKDNVDALNEAWEQLFGIEVSLEEAVAGFREDLANLRETITGTQEDTANWRSELIKANGEVNTATESGRDLLDNLSAQRESYLEVAQTAFDTARKKGQSEQEATEAAWEAVRSRKRALIEEMTQLDLTEDEANKLFDRYIGTDNLGAIVNQIRQPGMSEGIENADDLRHRYNQIPDSVSTTVTTIFTSRGTGPGAANRALSGAGLNTMADGGIVGFPNGGLLRGRGGPRSDSNLIAASDGEFIVNAQSTRQNLDLLRGINSGRVSSADARAVMPSGGGAGGGRGGTVTVRFDTTGADEGMKEMLRKMVRVDGHGDVQVALGS